VALTRYLQFRACIGETELHLYHLRGQGRNCLPLLLSHGWPGSVYEFLEVIEPLSAAGFDLVIPSIPDYGFSPRPAGPISPRQVVALDFNITRWSIMDRGGHFAAWETPKTFAREVATFFNTYR